MKVLSSTSTLSVGQLRQLVGNPNAFAVQRDDGSYEPVRKKLTPYVLRKHLSAEWTVGTYIVWGDKARTLVFDCDSGEESLEEAREIRAACEQLGIPSRSIGIEFSGSKGHHVWVVAANYVAASSLRRLGAGVLALSEIACEVFPKQDQARDLGNLVKLPGGVHRKTGYPNEFVTPPPQPVSVGILDRIIGAIPEVRTNNSGEAPPPMECMDNIQMGVGAGGRNMALLQAATHARRAGLVGAALAAAVSAINDGFDPPLPGYEVDHIVRNSANVGPICSQLPADLRCTDCPVLRPKGLYTKPGQLKHGGSGELAVVQLGKRRPDGTIELLHPDLTAGLVKV